jgi:hypothetical protein
MGGYWAGLDDSHMGLNKPANPDVVARLQAVMDKINGLPCGWWAGADYTVSEPSLEVLSGNRITQ